ncbi:MAG: hypothetical protein KatS3mg090_0541 [Patescibacteria group bacterium]|nr:MAG: hypothetical protein KatS3mg090_0541 [Patescibacteria group bacterium]
MNRKKKYLIPKIKSKKITNDLIVTAGSGTCCCGTCLSYNFKIFTVKGYVPIYKLKNKMQVYSIDKNKKIQIAKIKLISKKRVSKNHKLIKVTLESGKHFSASFWHPLSDNFPIGFLKKGDIYNNEVVKKIETCIYTFGYTYDILLDNKTNIYFTTGLIPLRSTLSLRKNQTLPKIKEYIISSTSEFKSKSLLTSSS